MKVVITGVGGFIGSHLARRCLAKGWEVIGVDDFSNGKRSNVPEGAALIEGDLALADTCRRLPARCDAVLHLAGQSSGEISFDDPVADLNKNTVSTLNLIRYGISAQANRLVYASSMSVYGDQGDGAVAEDARCRPLSCYGVGKLAAEEYLRIFAPDLPFVAFRMFNVYGPGQDLDNMRQGMVSIFLAQALRTGRIQVKGSLERFRDFIAVEDVVNAWVAAAERADADNRILNLGTGIRTTVGSLLEAIGACLPGIAWYCEGSTQGDQSGIYADPARLRQTLGLGQPMALTDGIGRFAAWARTQEG
ncbi:MAG: NAD-dependent epimerase/dehydratase family protein [Phaeospirillum sp.]|nr:NAD-dependent epimerase/dehydratase family protein [Phaeospirillum sp.]